MTLKEGKRCPCNRKVKVSVIKNQGLHLHKNGCKCNQVYTCVYMRVCLGGFCQVLVTRGTHATLVQLCKNRLEQCLSAEGMQ